MNKLILLLLCLVTFGVHAEDNQAMGSGWEFSFGLGNTNIDSDIAQQEFIEDSALSLDIAAHYLNNRYMATLGLTLIQYDDLNEFTVAVQNSTTGSISDEDSSADGVLIHGAYGPRWQPTWNENVDIYAQGGVALMASSERSVDFCQNCPEQDIDVNGGVFGKLGINFSFNAFSLGAQYQQYISGDLENTLTFTVSSSFR